MKTALVVLSGGQDSTTCLFEALQDHDRVLAITFDYEQRHKREIQAAREVIDVARTYYGHRHIEHEVIVLGPILKGTSPLVSNTELEQYADHKSLPGGIEKTFVPMRNQLFLTIAANRAVVFGANKVYTGVSQEDYGGYPDCREPFVFALEKATQLALEDAFTLTFETPLMHLSKAESVIKAMEYEGCYEALAYSHTAYDGNYPPAGKDHATLLRAKGFEEAGVADPLVLRAHNEGLMALPETSNYEKYRTVVGDGS